MPRYDSDQYRNDQSIRYGYVDVDCRLLLKQKKKISEEEQEREPRKYGSLITDQDEMCFWQGKSRIPDKWSWNEKEKKEDRECRTWGDGAGLMTLMAEVGRIKHGKSTEKRQFMSAGKK